MPIAVCPACQGKVRAAPHLLGRAVKCPKCGQSVVLAKVAARANGTVAGAEFDDEALYAAALEEIKHAPADEPAAPPVERPPSEVDITTSEYAGPELLPSFRDEPACYGKVERYAGLTSLLASAVVVAGSAFSGAGLVAGVLLGHAVVGAAVGIIGGLVTAAGWFGLRLTSALLLLVVEAARNLHELSRQRPQHAETAPVERSLAPERRQEIPASGADG